MRINPIGIYSNYKKQVNFGSSEEEVEESIPQSMLPIFLSPDIPQRLKRTTWELSQIPYFCEVSKDCSTGDILKISKIIDKAKTNVRQMALADGIKIEKNKKERSLLSLKKLVEEKQKLGQQKGINLLGIIKALPFDLIEADVERQYKEGNDYPDAIDYRSDTPNISIQTLDGDSFISNVTNALKRGKTLQGKGDLSIIFKKELKYKGEVNPQYYPTPEGILPARVKATPQSVKDSYRLKIATPEENERLSILEKIPYFNNLAETTEPLPLNYIAAWDLNNNGIFEKMFSKKVMWEVYNPRTEKTKHFPIIDLERLVADKKFGIYEEKDLIQILEMYTPAMAIYRTYATLKKECNNNPITSIIYKVVDNEVTIAGYSEMEDCTRTCMCTFANGTPDEGKIRAFLDKMPMKTATINFVPDEEAANSEYVYE